jgi:hypothetical protein
MLTWRLMLSTYSLTNLYFSVNAAFSCSVFSSTVDSISVSNPALRVANAELMMMQRLTF